jgi:hypothetical protein
MKVELTKNLLNGNKGGFMVSLNDPINLPILNNDTNFHFLKQGLALSI